MPLKSDIDRHDTDILILGTGGAGLFGALHARTILYAVIAGVVGVYFGVLMEVTDNLLTPVIAHGLYDAVALEYTRRAVGKARYQKT